MYIQERSHIIASEDISEMVVYDAGDQYIKCYTSTAGELTRHWHINGKGYLSMAIDPQTGYLVILYRDYISFVTFKNVKQARLECRWPKDLPIDVSIRGRRLAVCAGKEVCVYDMKYAEDDTDTRDC